MFSSTCGAIEHSSKWLFSEKGYYLKNSKFKMPPALEPTLGKNGLAIYCFHGTADFPASFQQFGVDLMVEGLPEIISEIRIISFSNRFTGSSIEDQAIDLIEQIVANGDTHVVLAGHSRGGLDAQRIDKLSAEYGIKVHLVLNISTPYQGSYLALWPLTTFSKSVGEMAISTKYLKTAAEEVLSSKAEYHFFVAPWDWIVEPKKCYVREYVQKHPDSLTMLDDESHLSIMGSKRLVSVSHGLIVKKAKSLIAEALAANLNSKKDSKPEDELMDIELESMSCS
ncbi:hypothetical protein BN59_01040 [Legionella massiliensis]|uniref:Lipase n=1 Tax=Legionella massiliensis TaxID=1034943 RepID=A0A078KQS9_9GAMM|nr:alpha/beta hydrolase [Legionella massiliensis]CDZ76765.1 hypothetical protein BN59_01040 [Legionella massiliensis]CEE12503.1 hypothetical protein BN1094_01040 [Legionella massiliensis]